MNRLLTLLVSLALIAFGVVLAVEVVVALVGADPLLVDWRSAYHAGRRDTWDSSAVRVLASAAVAVGLLLLLAQLKPRRIGRWPVSTDDRNTDAALTRAAVRSALRRAAEDVDGISAAAVKVGRRRATVVARTRADEPGLGQLLTAEVRRAAGDRLAALQLHRRLRLRIQVRTRRAGS